MWISRGLIRKSATLIYAHVHGDEENMHTKEFSWKLNACVHIYHISTIILGIKARQIKRRGSRSGVTEMNLAYSITQFLITMVYRTITRNRVVSWRRTRKSGGISYGWPKA